MPTGKTSSPRVQCAIAIQYMSSIQLYTLMCICIYIYMYVCMYVPATAKCKFLRGKQPVGCIANTRLALMVPHHAPWLPNISCLVVYIHYHSVYRIPHSQPSKTLTVLQGLPAFAMDQTDQT